MEAREGTMAAAQVVPTVLAEQPVGRFRTLRLETLDSAPPLRTRGATGLASLVLHFVALGAVLLVPLAWDGTLPEPDQVVRAFFVSPVELAAPPPPPPPPAAGPRPVAKAPAAARPTEPPRFVAPVEVPPEVRPEESLDLGALGGVEGGVEGGVPGGVVGGIVGGLPEAPPPPPAVKPVRVGGHIHPPKQVHRVDPVYPDLARGGRVQGMVVIEAHVGTDGIVKDARVLRGIILLDDAALAGVRPWRYQPLLINGQPMEFVLTVTVHCRC